MSEVVPNQLTLQVGEFYNLKLCADSADSKITDSASADLITVHAVTLLKPCANGRW